MKKINFEYKTHTWLIMLIFFIVFLTGQMYTVLTWSDSFKWLDFIQLSLVPACCFSLASTLGFHKNVWLFIISLPGTLFLGNLFYAFFQKLTFFKESDIFSLLITNNQLMGISFLIEFLMATGFSILYILLQKNK